MKACCIALFAGIAALGLGAAAPSATRDRDPVADALVDALNEARATRQVPAVKRDTLLDEVAERRAVETARLPEGRRFEEKRSIEELIRDAGRRRFATAAQYLAYQSGYEDQVSAAVSSWKSYEPSWSKALRAGWTEVGAATARASDGTLVIAVVLLEAARPLPAVTKIEADVVDAVNRERESRGLAPLAIDARLHPVARAHSEDMLRRDYFEHVSPEGIHPAERVTAAGIAYRKVAENLFSTRRAGDPVATAVAGWMASPGHRANIVDPSFTHTSVGVAVDPDEGEVILTQLFLRPPDPEPPPNTKGSPRQRP